MADNQVSMDMNIFDQGYNTQTPGKQSATDIAKAAFLRGEKLEGTLDEIVDKDSQKPDKSKVERAQDEVSTDQKDDERYKPYGREDDESDPQVEEGQASDDSEHYDKVSDINEDPNVEEIEANGLKIKIDYNNREKIKQIFMKAVGMRKFQKERDEARTKLNEVQPKYERLQSKMDELFKRRDNKNDLYEYITGENLDDLITSRIQEQNAVGQMSEEQKEIYDLRRQLEAKEKKKELQSKKDEDETKQSQTQAQQAEVQKMQATLTRAIDKYNFDGVFGDLEFEEEKNVDLFNAIAGSFAGKDTNDIKTIDVFRAFKAKRDREVSKLGSQTKNKLHVERETNKRKAQKEAQQSATKGPANLEDKKKFNGLRKAGRHKDILKDPRLRKFLN